MPFDRGVNSDCTDGVIQVTRPLRLADTSLQCHVFSNHEFCCARWLTSFARTVDRSGLQGAMQGRFQTRQRRVVVVHGVVQHPVGQATAPKRVACADGVDHLHRWRGVLHLVCDDVQGRLLRP